MLKNIFKNMKLGVKLNLILFSVFFVVILINGLFLSNVLQENAEEEVANQALVLIETITSVREYTGDQVNVGAIKKLSPNLDINGEFIKVSVPAYSAGEVFRNLRKREQYSDFLYKEATLNPTALKDKADSFEAQIVDRFRENITSNGSAKLSNPKKGAFGIHLRASYSTLPDLCKFKIKIVWSATVPPIKPQLVKSKPMAPRMALAGNWMKSWVPKLFLYQPVRYLPKPGDCNGL